MIRYPFWGPLLAIALLGALLCGCSQAAAEMVEEMVSSSVEQILSENPGSPALASRADSLNALLEDASRQAGGADIPLSPEISYTSAKEIALYLHTFGQLPHNFITQEVAASLGWDGGDLWAVAQGMSIGGDLYSDSSGLLPEQEERTWRICDVNYRGGARGDERIVYSSDGLIFYTSDLGASFTQLY